MTDHGIVTHDVIVERVAVSTDDTGWTVDSGREAVWTGRGTLRPNGATTDRSAASGTGTFDPVTMSSWVLILPPNATVAGGDVVTIDGTEYAVGHAVVRRGAVASLDHTRVEMMAI